MNLFYSCLLVFACVSLGTVPAYRSLQRSEETLDTLELELQMVNHDVGAGIKPGSPEQ